jgi:hypothetical protein
MIHRSFANQAADYQFLAELVRRARKSKRIAPSSPSRADATILANEILCQLGSISYFALHKLSFLAEVRHMEKYGRRITGSYYVRQKDGPYCVDLHPARLKKAGLSVEVVGGGNKPYVTKAPGGLFEEEMDAPALDESATLIVKTVIEKYAGLSDEKLKTAAYLAGPMRRILKLEKLGVPQFNAPVFVP